MSDWPIRQFDTLCDITRGGSPRPIHDFIRTEGIPWVKIADASAAGGRHIERTNDFIKPEGRTKSRTVFPGDLILSNSATPGIPMFMRIEACIHDGWLLLRDFKGLDKLFCYYLLKHERPRLLAQGNGSVFMNLKTEILKTHRVPLPPIDEQRAIASVLGSLDDKIELNRRMNRTLEQMAAAIFKAWFVDFEPVRAKASGAASFSGMPQPVFDVLPATFVDSELGPIPEGWEPIHIGDDAKVSSGKRPPSVEKHRQADHQVPVWGGGGLMGYTTETLYNDKILVTGRVGTLGKVFRLSSHAWPSDNTLLVSSGDRLGHEFLYQALRLADLANLNRGSTQPLLTQRDLKSQLVPLASESVNSSFEQISCRLFDLVRHNDCESESLAETRDALLPKLLSGEVRVGHEVEIA